MTLAAVQPITAERRVPDPSPETGIDFTALTAGTIITVLPILVAFLLLQRRFIQSFSRTGIE